MINHLIYFLIMLELLVVGWLDFKFKKISNYWAILNLLLSVFFHLFLNKLYPFSLEVIIFPFSFLALGFLLYLMNIMGAGDSKFIASLFLVIPLEFHLLFLNKLFLSTIVHGFLFLTLRIIRQRKFFLNYLWGWHWPGIKQMLSARYSYAPIIFLSWILMGELLWK